MGLLSDPLPLADHRAHVREYLRGIAPPLRSVAATIIEARERSTADRDFMRPSLVLWACAACGGDRGDALPVAAAFDLFDRFMLLHDELMEDGENAVERWGLGQSLNAGDALYALAFRSLAENVAHPQRRLAVAAIVARAVLEAIGGRNDDVGRAARGGRPGLLATVRSARRRSAGLTGAALQAGAMVAGASEPIARAFLRAGRLLAAAGLTDDPVLSHRLACKALAAIEQCRPTPAVAHLEAFAQAASYVAARAA